MEKITGKTVNFYAIDITKKEELDKVFEKVYKIFS